MEKINYKEELIDLILRNENALVFVSTGMNSGRDCYLYNITASIKVCKYIEKFSEYEQCSAYELFKEKLNYDYVTYARGILDNECINSKTTK